MARIHVHGRTPSIIRLRPARRSLDDYELEKQLYRGKASLLYSATCRHSGLRIVLKLYRKHKLSELNWYQVRRGASVWDQNFEIRPSPGCFQPTHEQRFCGHPGQRAMLEADEPVRRLFYNTLHIPSNFWNHAPNCWGNSSLLHPSG